MKEHIYTIVLTDALAEKCECPLCVVEKKFDADVVTFTSASTVRGFVNAFKELNYEAIKAVCIGEQTAAEARKYGMQISISKEASMDSMMELILEEYGIV